MRAGALALVRAVQYLPEGVVLAVVDPGVGTERRCIAVEVENGFLVGPDNGLLAPAVAMLGGPARVVELDNRRVPARRRPGPTFAGRDVMAPAAAYLARGRADRRARPGGRPACAHARRSSRSPARTTTARSPARCSGSTAYGNCQLNVAPEQLELARRAAGDPLEVTSGSDAVGGRTARRARWVRAFADAKPSELVLLVDSYGMCALALDRRSAAAELGSGLRARHAGTRPRRRSALGVPIGLGREARS